MTGLSSPLPSSPLLTLLPLSLLLGGVVVLEGPPELEHAMNVRGEDPPLPGLLLPAVLHHQLVLRGVDGEAAPAAPVPQGRLRVAGVQVQAGKLGVQ